MSRGYRDAFPVDSRSSASPGGRPGFFTAPDGAFPGLDFTNLSQQQRLAMFQDILNRKVHGLAFSPYLDGQEPGQDIREEQIRQRLEIVAPYTRWIRTFSCTEGNEAAPRLAHAMGLKTMVGMNLGPDAESNAQEIVGGLNEAQAGHADILAVGNEVLLRGDLTEDQLLDHIARVRRAAPDQTLGYVDAYFLFEKHPRVAAACDVLLINCYPFWESCPFEYALAHMQEMHRRIQRLAGGKRIIISETGWPSSGSPYGAAFPGLDQARDYFINTYTWAEAEGIDIVYFAAFDEQWKAGDEGDVGASWGLWNSRGELKHR